MKNDGPIDRDERHALKKAISEHARSQRKQLRSRLRDASWEDDDSEIPNFEKFSRKD